MINVGKSFLYFINQRFFQREQKANEIENKKLIQDVKTHWNSSFLMLEDIQEQVIPVNETLRDRIQNN